MTRLLAVDTGGTFNDFVIVEDDGTLRIHKTASTPQDPSRAVLRGSVEAGVDLARLGQAVHGTTVGTNTVIQKRGVRTGLITTRGYRDALELRRSIKPPGDYFNLRWRQPEPLAPRYLRCEVAERVTFDGSVVEPLDEAGASAALDYLAGHGVEAVAICLLFSYANPAHEERILQLARERHPHLYLSASSRILPQWREYERTSTTVADAYIKPPLARYFGRLEGSLKELGYRGDLLIMKSNGGVMTARAACELPIATFLSGPAAGAVAGRFVGEAAGFQNVMTMDMGGTSFDLSLVREGRLTSTAEGEIEPGVPVLLPMLDIRTIGAGGGSIARVDAGGGLKVGPQSAGAEPGPASYGQGGTEPTITDANLVLGRLNPDFFLAGRLRLDAELARRAVAERIAAPLNLALEVAARGIVDICVHGMTREVRAISAQKGYDPRDFALVAGGGAGPLHAPLIAERLGIRTVVVPPYPGLLSALGLLLSDLKFDAVRSWPFVLEWQGTEEVVRILEELVAQGRAQLAAEGYRGEPVVQRSLDVRYKGQNWEIAVPVPAGPLSAAAVAAAFDAEHERLYGFRVAGAEHEVTNLRVTVVGPRERPRDLLLWRQRTTPPSGRPRGTRPVYTSDRWAETPIWDRDDLAPGQEIAGPAIAEQMDSTTYIPPGWRAAVDRADNLVLVRG